ANIKALETLGYAEHICNYVVILDSWFYGKIYVVGTPSNLGLILEHITILAEAWILSIYLNFSDIWFSNTSHSKWDLNQPMTA
ncbi:MAG: hypothetical protein L6406_21565, partial [Desulfobacterales bacterium]|nr:hypothetical protein [Desulfobacterales bacterium]